MEARVQIHSPLFYAHVELAHGTSIEVPDGVPERAAYVVTGSMESEGRTFHDGQLLVFKPGGQPALTAEGETTLMLLGGEPVGLRHIEWNFVSSSKDRIEQAKADWRAGRMK